MEPEQHLKEFRAELSEYEQHLVGTHDVLTIRGKRGRPVPVLLTPELRLLLDRLADEDVRKQVGVEDNRYLFANYGKTRLYLPTLYRPLYCFESAFV